MPDIVETDVLVVKLLVPRFVNLTRRLDFIHAGMKLLVLFDGQSGGNVKRLCFSGVPQSSIDQSILSLELINACCCFIRTLRHLQFGEQMQINVQCSDDDDVDDPICEIYSTTQVSSESSPAQMITIREKTYTSPA